MLKANAYSLGDIEIAQSICHVVDWFAVANIREGAHLRKGGITKPILLFGVCENFSAAITHNLTITIGSVGEMRALIKVLSNINKHVYIHIKVNTGMNRYGISSLWNLRTILDIAQSNPSIVIGGLYTHMAFECDNIPGIDSQLKKFLPFRKYFSSRYPNTLIHAACSGSAEYLPAQFDMVRIGKILYGGLDGYKTAVTIKSKITAIQNVSKASKIGYNGTHTMSCAGVIGVVPCGYADLTHFNFSNNAHVLVDNKLCRVVGRICMDAFMIDVTDIQKPLGKTVTVYADRKGITLMDRVSTTKTVTCNILCSFNFGRTEIVYKK